jgi:hypothetical protein
VTLRFTSLKAKFGRGSLKDSFSAYRGASKAPIRRRRPFNNEGPPLFDPDETLLAILVATLNPTAAAGVTLYRYTGRKISCCEFRDLVPFILPRKIRKFVF